MPSVDIGFVLDLIYPRYASASVTVRRIGRSDADALGDADHVCSGGDGDELLSGEIVEGDDEPTEQVVAPFDDLLHWQR